MKNIIYGQIYDDKKGIFCGMVPNDQNSFGSDANLKKKQRLNIWKGPKQLIIDHVKC